MCNLQPYAQTVRLQWRVWTHTVLGYSYSSYNHTSSPKCAAGSFKICITWHASIISINAPLQIQRMKQTNVFRVRWHFKKSRKINSGNKKNEDDTERIQKMIKRYGLYLPKYCTGFFTFRAYTLANKSGIYKAQLESTLQFFSCFWKQIPFCVQDRPQITLKG
jgi:hypothetical protein